MANSSAITTYDINSQYVGELALLGKKKTPFLNLITGGGGENWVRNFRVAKDWEFPLYKGATLEAAAQPAITETASLTAGTPTTYDTSQATNCCQIYQKPVNVSYAALSATNKLSGLAIVGEEFSPSDKDFQIEMNLKQIAIDLDKTLIAGAYQAGANKDTAWKTKGITAAITTNAINGGGDALTTTDIEDAMIALAETKESPMDDLYIMGGAAAIKKLADLYGFAPFAGPTNTIGGGKINTIITQFGDLKVMWDPYVAAATLLIVDVAQCSLVGLPVPGKGVLFYEELAKVGASEKGQVYGQIGFDYNAEEFHAKITNFI
jgi:hypothetical protein